MDEHTNAHNKISYFSPVQESKQSFPPKSLFTELLLFLVQADQAKSYDRPHCLGHIKEIEHGCISVSLLLKEGKESFIKGSKYT